MEFIEEKLVVNKLFNQNNNKINTNKTSILKKLTFPDKQSVTILYNKDFTQGTYRITKPGIYKLGENITFHPNPDNDFLPKKEQENKYKVNKGPYVLGFFAAITIEAENVILDLNGKTLKQSSEFYLKQRFFNLIELASAPFIIGQGPGNFGKSKGVAKNCRIQNGVLGLSSHNGIHGNSSENIEIANLKITNFEVGGIGLNGVKNIKIENVSIFNSLGTNLKVPVNGRWSPIIFLLRKLNTITKDFYFKSGETKLSLLDTRDKLLRLVQQGTAEILKKGLGSPIVFSDPEVQKYFGNPGGMPDGSAIYGILFNKKGIAIHDFGCCNPESTQDFSENIEINNVLINNLVLEPRELIGIKNKNDGKFIVDFSGSLVNIANPNGPWFNGLNIFNQNRSFYDSSNDYDLILAIQVLTFLYSQSSPENKSFQGVSNIPKQIIDYVSSGYTVYKQIDNDIYTFRNTDIMAHVMKGIIGVRVDFTNNVSLNNITVTKLVNSGKPGLTSKYLGNYIDKKEGEYKNHLGHPKSTNNYRGYTANFTRGISLIYAKNLIGNQININNLTSFNGPVIGVDIQDHCYNCYFSYLQASHLNGFIHFKFYTYKSNIGYFSIGVAIDYETRDIIIVNKNISLNNPSNGKTIELIKLPKEN